MPTTAIPAADIGLPGENLDELHDTVMLALDAIGNEPPSERDVREARQYLVDSLCLLAGRLQ